MTNALRWFVYYVDQCPFSAALVFGALIIAVIAMVELAIEKFNRR